MQLALQSPHLYSAMPACPIVCFSRLTQRGVLLMSVLVAQGEIWLKSIVLVSEVGDILDGLPKRKVFYAESCPGANAIECLSGN